MISLIGMLVVAQSCTLNTNLLLRSNSLLPEASDIVKVGSHYYVVGDDTCAITKITQDGSATLIPTRQCSKSDFEALFRLPGDTDDTNPTLVICKEDARNCSPWKNGEFLNDWTLVDGGENCHDDVKWGKNKGIEGAVGVKNAQGEIFMMTLIEGTGSIITYRLDTTASQWVSQSCTSVPASFSDYSGMALRDSTLAVVSQSSRKLWVGEVTQLFELRLSSGAVYDFPRKFEGVEGIFIENLDSTTGSMSGVICSDDQAGSGNYANAVHRFSLTCDANIATTMPSQSPTMYSATKMPSPSTTHSSGQSTYYLSERAYCDIQSELITDETECEAAAVSLGLSDLTVKSFSKQTRPYGCFFRTEAKTNQLWLNTDVSAERDSEDDSRRSLCLRTSSGSVAPSQSPSSPASTSIESTQSSTSLAPTSMAPTKSPTSMAPTQSPTKTSTTQSVVSTKSPTSSPTTSPTSSPEKKKDSESDSDDSDEEDRRNRRILDDENNASLLSLIVAIVLTCALL